MSYNEMNATGTILSDGMPEAETRGVTTFPPPSPGNVDVQDIAAVKAKYGEVWQIGTYVGGDDETEGTELVYLFKTPTTPSFNRYMKNASKNMSAATAAFVRDNIIDEQAASFDKESAKYPGLALGIGQKLLQAIGLGDNVNFKRL